MNNPDQFLVIAIVVVCALAILGGVGGVLIAKRCLVFKQSNRRSLLIIVSSVIPILVGPAIASVSQILADQSAIEQMRNDFDFRTGYEESVTYQGPFVKTYWIWNKDAVDQLDSNAPEIIELRSKNELPSVVGSGGAKGFMNPTGELIQIHIWFAVVTLLIMDGSGLMTWWLFRTQPVQGAHPLRH